MKRFGSSRPAFSSSRWLQAFAEQHDAATCKDRRSGCKVVVLPQTHSSEANIPQKQSEDHTRNATTCHFKQPCYAAYAAFLDFNCAWLEMVAQKRRQLDCSTLGHQGQAGLDLCDVCAKERACFDVSVSTARQAFLLVEVFDVRGALCLQACPGSATKKM